MRTVRCRLWKAKISDGIRDGGHDGVFLGLGINDKVVRKRWVIDGEGVVGVGGCNERETRVSLGPSTHAHSGDGDGGGDGDWEGVYLVDREYQRATY